MMTAEQLKGSILQLAMQGKLVDQRSEEGTGEDLYKTLLAEKKKLIKEGKIKKQKPLPEISEDEIPFEIPDSWLWVRVTDICTKLVDGDHNPPKGISGTSEFIMASSRNINQDRLIDLEQVRYLDKDTFLKENERTMASKGDIFFTSVGSLGRSCVYDGSLNICFQRSVSVMTTLIFNHYLKRCFDSGYFQNKVNREATGTAQKGFYLNQLAAALIPLPPLAEQKRIVAKIEELMPFVEQYAAASTKLNTLNTSFPEMMKKSILQEAVQGKLVPQDPNDEPASLLLKKIAEEKKRLIKEGKIKKQKPLPEITEDEIPFDIPESWEWVRVNDILVLENGDRSNKYPKEMDYVDEGVPFFGARDMVNGKMDFSSVRFISEDKYNELGGGKLKDGDLVCLLRGSVGKIACFYENEQYSTGFICAQMVIMRLIIKELLPYIQVMTETPYYKKSIGSRVTGTAVRQLPAAEISKVVIPIPPLAEQKRIVSKIHEMMISVIELTDKSEL